MRGPIRAYQSPSNAIKRHPTRSKAIQGDRTRSEAIRGTDDTRVVASTFWFCGCAPAAAMSASIPPESAMDSAISSTSDRFRRAAVTCVKTPRRSSAAIKCNQHGQIPQSARSDSAISTVRFRNQHGQIPQSARTDSTEPRRHLRLNRCTLEVRPRRIDEHLKPLRVRNRLFRVI